MRYANAIWDLDDDLTGNVQHILEHGITKLDVEEVLLAPWEIKASRTSGRPIAFGMTQSGRVIAVIFEEVDTDTAYPITAYEVDP
jgi:uncharacterized DUF497 family protein